MRLLLDTHALVWSVDAPARLSAVANEALKDQTNDVSVSAATIWELAIKVGLGKLTLSMPYRQWMESAIGDLKLDVIPVTLEYADRMTALPNHHKDPFDRLIIAPALVDGIPIISADVIFDTYSITRIWEPVLKQE